MKYCNWTYPIIWRQEYQEEAPNEDTVIEYDQPTFVDVKEEVHIEEKTESGSEYENVEYLDDECKDMKPSTSNYEDPAQHCKSTFSGNWSEEEEEEKKQPPDDEDFEFVPPSPEEKKKPLPRRLRAKVCYKLC